MQNKRAVLLSFDVEEFDMPLEYGIPIGEEEQLSVGYQGLETLMNIVERNAIEASFFTTANFARHYPDAIRSIAARHEIASHTFYHSRFEVKDLLQSRQKLEEITGKKIWGLRMPRMRAVGVQDIIEAGYHYDSSINPTYLPGRYNNRHLPRNYYREAGMLRLPASVTPVWRIPLFWLTFKNFPYPIYRRLVLHTLKRDGYVCLYFHPWEFVSLDPYKMPLYTKRHAGAELCKKLQRLVEDLSQEAEFLSIEKYIRLKGL